MIFLPLTLRRTSAAGTAVISMMTTVLIWKLSDEGVYPALLEEVAKTLNG
jgi:hypothetical protein